MDILSRNARADVAEIAALLHTDAAHVSALIKELEDSNVFAVIMQLLIMSCAMIIWCVH